jgi:hypothetical protein
MSFLDSMTKDVLRFFIFFLLCMGFSILGHKMLRDIHPVLTKDVLSFFTSSGEKCWKHSQTGRFPSPALL